MSRRYNTWRRYMLGAAIGCVVLFGTVHVTQAATDVCGEISQDTVWKADASPYMVNCTVTVLRGAKLTIEPGVMVRFPKATRRDKVGLMIKGELTANGTENQPILFTSDEKKPVPGDWGGMTFSESSAGARFDEHGAYIGGSSLQYCVIEFGGAPLWQGVVEVLGASLYLDNVVIHKNSGSGIRVRDGKVRLRHGTLTRNSNSTAGSGGAIIAHFSDVVVEHSTFIDTVSAGSGGAIYAQDSRVTIRDSELINNESAGSGGAVFVRRSTLDVSDTLFHKNETPVKGGAVYAGDSTVSVRRSVFSKNRTLPTAALGEGEGKSTKHAMGAALFSDASTITIAGTVFMQNQAVTECGALAVRSSSLDLSGSFFLENTSVYNGAALCIEHGTGDSSVAQTTFTRNVSDKYLTANTIYLESGAFPAFTNNNIHGNFGYDIVDNTGAPLRVGGNWWGTTDESAIAKRVYGHARDRQKSTIEFIPLLEEAVDIPNPAKQTD